MKTSCLAFVGFLIPQLLLAEGNTAMNNTSISSRSYYANRDRNCGLILDLGNSHARFLIQSWSRNDGLKELNKIKKISELRETVIDNEVVYEKVKANLEEAWFASLHLQLALNRSEGTYKLEQIVEVSDRLSDWLKKKILPKNYKNFVYCDSMIQIDSPYDLPSPEAAKWLFD